MPRLRATMTFEYDADPENYQEDGVSTAPTSLEMAKVDIANIGDDPWLFAEMAAGYPVKIVVEAVE